MRLGIHLPQYGRAASPDAIATVARRAEELGYADVWVSDHVVHPAAQGYPSAYLFDPLLTLSWAAAATTDVRLGTSVLVVPQYHPLQLANSLASLDRLSGGRLTVGAGVGWSAAEFDALDQDFSTRGARTNEALEIFRAVWGSDPTSYTGRHYSFADLKVQPKPAQERVPIWVGGGGPVAYERAVVHGDGYQAISTAPEDLAPVVAELRAQRPEDFTISYRTGWDPHGMDPAQIVDEAAAYADAGVDHVVAAPWRSDLDSWLAAMEQLIGLVEGR